MIRKAAALLLAAAVLCLSMLTSFALETENSDTTITTVVPSVHEVTFITHGGSVENGGISVGESTEYGRLSRQTYTLVPRKGEAITQVLYNGEDVTTQIIGGAFYAPPLIKDSVLEVFFTGDDTSESPGVSGKAGNTSAAPAPQAADTAVSSARSESVLAVITGDASAPMIFILLLFAAAVLAVVLASARKRKNDG